MLFRFPPDARWNPERPVVEFGIGVGALPAGADTRAQRALFHYRQNGTRTSEGAAPDLGGTSRHCSLGKAWHWGPNRVNPTRRGSTRCQSP